jgi:hypothetical protein
MSNLNSEKIDDLHAAVQLVANYRGAEADILSNRRNKKGLTLIQSLAAGGTAKLWAIDVDAITKKERGQRQLVNDLLSPREVILPKPAEIGKRLLDEEDD